MTKAELVGAMAEGAGISKAAAVKALESYIGTVAKELKKNSTESERILWKELRGRRFAGFKFLRQHPIIYKGNMTCYNFFIADFYCDQKKTIIELDGPFHESSEEYDEFRDK